MTIVQSYPSPITARSGSIPIAAGPVEDVLTPSPARAENK